MPNNMAFYKTSTSLDTVCDLRTIKMEYKNNTLKTDGEKSYRSQGPVKTDV